MQATTVTRARPSASVDSWMNFAGDIKGRARVDIADWSRTNLVLDKHDVRLHDARPETTADDTNFGMGVRVVVDGAVGFAATVDVRPEEAANLVRSAIETARVTARVRVPSRVR